MASPKKPTYEWVERLGLYRKRIKDTDGKYVAIYGKTPEELTEKIEVAKYAVKEAAFHRDNPTIQEYAGKWLSLYTSEMKSATSNVYKNAVYVHILPQIGDMRIQDITPDTVKSILVQMAGLSFSMQSKTLNTMRKIFEAAYDNGLVSRNPCEKIKPAGNRAKEKYALTDEQRDTLIDAVTETRAEPFVMLGFYTGMRREEILGLQWNCVHLSGDAPHVTVKRALQWKNCQPIIIDELKTKAAKRNIPIPLILVDYLKTQKGNPDEFVVGGSPLSQQQFRNLWRIIERRETGEGSYRIGKGEKATFLREKGAKSQSAAFRYTVDFDVTPHILRHTYITHLILAGVDLKTVQYLAGHTDPQVTLKVYTHLMHNRPIDLIYKVNLAFN